jgi:hypothetical protein
MNQHPPVDLNTNQENWLDQLLAEDAQRDDLPADASFAAALMASLPSRPSFEMTDVARLVLSSVASGVAAIVVVEHGPDLLNQFTKALVALQPATMIETAAPFAVLLGLVWFTFRQQDD